ncbi:MAG TPA: cell division protein FtsZ [Verrucomicrobiae bacterium]|nr:cell division protein FtsZ [Verrucomicrobiae bacterium]
MKLFGVGTAGMKVVEQIAALALPGISCAAVGAELPATSTIAQRICLGSGATTEEITREFKTACSGAGIVFIVAGLGGGTGTRIAPLLAQAARHAGALALAIVTLPFQCEGTRRRRHAQDALQALKENSDGVICLHNQRILRLIDDSTSLVATFKMLDALLAGSITGVWKLLACRGMIDISPADFFEMLRDHHGESALASAQAAGPERCREVLEKLFAHPMLEGGRALAECDGVLVSLVGGPDLAMSEVNRVMEAVSAQCHDAQVLMGAGIDESCQGRLSITLIATQRKQSLVEEAGIDEAAHAAAARPVGSLEKQLLDRGDSARPQSRFVPPPPSLPPEKLEQLMANQRPGSGRRKSLARMRQSQLPLEIISRGRFDKSEPTIHKGEDLDVPTYIRRGMALN